MHRAIYDLGAARNSSGTIPDEVVEGLLTLLRSDDMYKSNLAGNVLRFFEFRTSNLSARQKWLCIGFLNAHGDEFTNPRGQRAVAELREGNYLNSGKAG